MNLSTAGLALCLAVSLPMAAQNTVYYFPKSGKVAPLDNPRLSDQPYLIAPYDAASKELRLLSGGRQHIFEPTAAGFKWLRAESLPASPEDLVRSTDQNQYFMLGPKGHIYFAGGDRLYGRSDLGWSVLMEYPEDWYRSKRDHSRTNSFSMAILAEDTLLVATTAKNLFEIYDLSQKPLKLVESISYSSAGAGGSAGFNRLPDPIKVLTLGSTSWVLIPGNGRLFKLRHEEGWSLSELDVPWHAWHAGAQLPQGEWKNESAPPFAPKFPCAAEFIPDAAGSSFSLVVPVNNIEEGLFYDCEIQSDSNSMRSTQKPPATYPDWVLFLNEAGLRTPLKDLFGSPKKPVASSHTTEVTK